jgi:hypothetical protein
MPSTSSIFFNNLTRKTTKKVYIKLISGYNHPIRVNSIESHEAFYLSFETYKEGNNIALEVTITGCKIPNEKLRGVDRIHIHAAHIKSSPTNIAIQWE